MGVQCMRSTEVAVQHGLFSCIRAETNHPFKPIYKSPPLHMTHTPTNTKRAERVPEAVRPLFSGCCIAAEALGCPAACMLKGPRMFQSC